MRKGFLFIVLLAGVWCSACLAADSKKGPATDSLGTQTSQTADEQAIRQSAERYIAAFNKGDAKAMGLLWTANCEYVDETGRVFRGRDAVEKQYEVFFAENKGLTLQISISSIKIVGGNAAIEDGTGILKDSTGAMVSRGSYTAIHVKEGDYWLIASVREHAAPSLSNRLGLKDLEWLVGDWVATKDSKTLEFSIRWIVEKQFLELAYTARDKGSLTRSGIQIVGRDPLSGDVISWSFDSTGGHGRGHWKLLKRGVTIESRGTMADGAPTAATEILSKIDAESFTWKSVNRRVAEQNLYDTDAVVVKRKQK